MQNIKNESLTIGFIGCGKMGGAIASAIQKSQAISNIIITTKDPQNANNFAIKHGNKFKAGSIQEASNCDIVFLATKPNVINEVLGKTASLLQQKSPILISMLAGVSIDKIKEFNLGKTRIFRIMPNLPALIAQSMTALCYENAYDGDIALVKDLLSYCGKVEVLEEKLMDAVTAVSGSSPAFAFIFIEAMADAAVSLGVQRSKAYTMVAQTLKGTASMILENSTHPACLKDDVCSPNGTTIQGVLALEETGFRASVEKAIIAAYNKCKALSK